MTVDELQVLITAKTDALRKEIEKANKSIAGLEKQANKTQKGLTKAFAKGGLISKAVSKSIGYITSSLNSAINRMDTLNNYTKVMGNLGVSSEDAEASIKRLSDKLVGLPTTLDEASLSVQRFTSANGDVKASTEMYLALNNAILSGGANMQIQSSAMEQLSQAYAKGKPDMMEWRSAMTAMPAQLNQVAKAMGLASANDLGESLRNGSISMNDFMKKLVEMNQKGVNGFASFEEQARNSTGGIGTSIANVKTAFTRGLAEIMNAIGQSNIAGFFQGIAKAINKVIPYITGFVKATVWAVSMVSSVFGKKPQSQVQKVSDSMKNLGTSAGGSTSKGLDKATGSAKKLNKELKGLASFDEMNVLNESSSDGGGDSGGGATFDMSGIDLSGFDTDMSKVVDKSSEIADKIKKVFGDVGKTLKNIWDSKPVQAYINNLKVRFNGFVTYSKTMWDTISSNAIDTWGDIEGNVGQTFTNMSELFTQYWNDTAVAIEEWTPIISESIGGLFTSIWTDYIDPALQIITQAWSDFTGILLKQWNKHGKPLVDNIGEFVNNIVGQFQSLWDNIIEPIVAPFLETLSWLWDKHLKGLVEEVIDFVGTLINAGLEIYNKFIFPISNFLREVLAPAFAWLGSIISGVLGSVVAVVSDTVKSILGFFRGVIDFVMGVFTGDWERAWNGVKTAFKNIIDGLLGIFKFPINVIIDGINAFISGLNKLKIPDWVPGVGGKGLNIPKIQKLARGGVVDRPTYAMVGEAGKEVVMPLERNTGWITELANKLDDKISGGDQPINLTIKLGEDTIYSKFIDYQEKRNFETNGEVFL